MNQNLYQSGVSLLNALSRHSDVIMRAYLVGSVDEKAAGPKVLESLQQLGVLWRPEPDAELRLKSVVRNLLEGSLQDERNRQIDTNMGSALAAIKTLSQHYKEALHHNRFVESQGHLGDLRQHVYALTESLANNVRLLFSRINNEFGYVASVDAKIRENELAQSQVSELLNQIELIRFDELGELAGNNRELRHLLVVMLQQSFTKVTKELSAVQARLIELIGRFREFRGRTRLLKGFVLHTDQNPQFSPRDYTAGSSIPSLFTCAPGLLEPASVDVNRVEHEPLLQDLVAHIRKVNRVAVNDKHDRAASSIDISQVAAIEIDDSQLRKAVEAYFCYVIDTGERITALQYLQWQQLDFDAEVWLYQVIGGYQSLDPVDQQFFAIEATGEAHPQFSGNYLIHDIELGLQ
ncbi:phosphoenolpyruvate carboxylase [Alteromonas oceanisediminis]|uniref:phosphoenolpyruvate carboxylase n=1 Tax=Alteromonas oceanisediminis TaxID=2836180 RepID=UPI001BDA8DB6|nr:phosphoenolpyruvate carboxylase [Alteromonas oceanisediminis]MBT0585125.1 phosphoenolpyruvate carboxylase [Alteromonas oceanisediminis]